MCYNNVDRAEWQRSALCSSAVLLQGDAGALCGARLGEGSAEGSSLALWGCAELMLCNLHFVGFFIFPGVLLLSLGVGGV